MEPTMTIVNDKSTLQITKGTLKPNSTVRFTLEEKDGSAYTFISLDDMCDIFNDVPKDEFITDTLVTVNLDGEDCTIKVPLLKGYQKPYDWAITDEIGTEHFLYYEEIND